jgi:hypothetical protein
MARIRAQKISKYLEDNQGNARSKLLMIPSCVAARKISPFDIENEPSWGALKTETPTEWFWVFIFNTHLDHIYAIIPAKY